MASYGELFFGFAILLYLFGISDAGYCTESYTCYRKCYTNTKTTTGCWVISRCTKYKKTSYSCKSTCYRRVCCRGYTGSHCSTPLCFGSTVCPNEGTCLSPDKCSCRPGFSSTKCSDINECGSSSLNKCTQKCINTHGSYRCSCNAGYKLLADGNTCQDINECATGTAGCKHSCINTAGSFKCSCKEGYELDSDRKSCKDSDECRRGISGCEHNCVNSIGSFKCSCNKGYHLAINERSCSDIDECVEGTADCTKMCINTLGSYKCDCNDGHTLAEDGITCLDIDECSVANGGCDHLCVNEPGTFKCKCRQGFMIDEDEKTCLDIDECEKGISGCTQTCQNTFGSFICDCEVGYELQVDLMTCADIDDCQSVTCQNGGSCRDGLNSYSCSCMPGYTSKHCEKDFNECLSYNGGCQEVCINTEGSYRCGCYDDRHLNGDGKSCPGGSNTDGNVFERYNIGGGLLPKPCFVLPLSGCTDGTNITLQLVSTSEWYKVAKQPTDFFTYGITFAKVEKLSLPISLSGFEVSLEDGIFSINHGVQHDLQDGVLFVDEETSSDCKSFELVESDIFDFISRGSFFRTLLLSLFPALPNWISFDKTNNSVLEIKDVKSDLIYGKDMVDMAWCDGAPTINNHLYTVFTFDSNFSLSVLGEDIKIPVPLKGEKFCLIVDLCHANGGSVFLMIPTESKTILENINIFKQLGEKFGLQIFPRGIGLSIVEGINVHHHKSELQLWNGYTSFTYPVIPRGDIWIGGDVSIAGDLINSNLMDMSWKAYGRADVYINVPNLGNILTSIFKEEWNLFIDSTMTLTLKIKVFGGHFDIHFPRLAAVESYTSIGGKNRTWCGEKSNPPGIFFSVVLKINPFTDVPILQDWVFDNTHVALAFVTYEPNEHTIEFDIKNDILNFDKSVDRLHHLFNTTAYALKTVFTDTTEALIYDITTILNELKTQIQHIFGIIMSGNLSEAKHLFENIWTTFVGMESKINLFFLQTEFILQDYFVNFKRLLKDEMNILKTSITTTANEITNKLIKFASTFTGFGFKYTVSLKIFGLYLGHFDIELVYSDGALLRCSRFFKIKELLKGKQALRYIGRDTRIVKLNFFLQSRIGMGIGGAISLSDSEFIAQRQLYINVLGMKTTGDLFITRNGLYLYIEGNIWNIFLAHVDISAELGKHWNVLTFRVKGQFVSKARKRRQIQTDSSSFKDSYLDGLKKAINFIADMANKRLSQAHSLLTSAQKGFSKAQSWLENKQKNVKDADVAFDKAIFSLEKAKDKLESAKGPFEIALKALEKVQKNVDNLCKIKSCKTICIPGFKCKMCKKRVLFGKVSYPCCSHTKCMISFPDPICVIANKACRIIRAVAYVALEAAKIFVRIPMLAFDAAKVLVSVAQVVVDKSRIILDVAIGLLEMAKIGLEFAKGVFEAAKLAVEAVKFALGAAVKVLEFVIDIGIKTIIDVRNCGFDLQISTSDLPVFAVSCDVNAFKLGWTPMKIKINFKNILQSIWNAARATIDALMKNLNNIIGRKRREIMFKSNAKIHATMFRALRDADEFYEPEPFVNETIDVSGNISGQGEDIYDDYKSRVLLFREKCLKISPVMKFMQESFNALHGVVNDSMQVITDAGSLKDDLHSYTNDALIKNMTLEDVGISKEYAGKDYNMTDDDLDKAVEETKASMENDTLLSEINAAAELSLGIIDEEMESIENINFLDIWLVAMENITEDYFTHTECKGFRDCILYSISALYDLYEDEDIPDLDEIKLTILDLESDLIELFQNETQFVTDMSIAMNSITEKIKFLYDANPFCSVAPNLLSDLKNQTVLQSMKAIFICNATGNPNPKYWWLKNEQFLQNEHQMRLVISNVTTEDNATYACIAGNVVANITSNEAHLRVLEYDDDECEVRNGDCDHDCFNTIGSFKCSCFSGYILNEDMYTCSALLKEPETEESDIRNIVLAVSSSLLGVTLLIATTFFVYTKFSKAKVMPEPATSRIAAKGTPQLKVVPDGPVVEAELGPRKTTFSKYFNAHKIGSSE